jgi:hypothetical protein
MILAALFACCVLRIVYIQVMIRVLTPIPVHHLFKELEQRESMIRASLLRAPPRLCVHPMDRALRDCNSNEHRGAVFEY